MNVLICYFSPQNRELPETVTNNLGRLQFEEYLTDSRISRVRQDQL